MAEPRDEDGYTRLRLLRRWAAEHNKEAWSLALQLSPTCTHPADLQRTTWRWEGPGYGRVEYPVCTVCGLVYRNERWQQKPERCPDDY